jgi:prophage antirepressor-like protein/very-short-patch-repair endonuclease
MTTEYCEIYDSDDIIIEESSDEEENQDIKDLTIFNNEKDNYYIGSEICELLGYKNTTQSIKINVSDNNKISFKKFSGKKELKLDPRQILINKEGVYELLEKNKKISQFIIDILIKANIDVYKIIKRETDDDDDEKHEKGELTIYSYINNGYCFEYFVGFEITSKLGYKNAKQTLVNVSKQNKLEFRDYPGVKKPNLDPKTILITRDGAIEILIKTRKRLSPDVLHIFKEFGIDTTNRKCLTKEQQTLSAIGNSFKIEKIEDQFKIGKYYLDLYFSEYKIVVECDENGHSDRKPCDERERMNFVNEKLEIDDSYWIRFNPDEYDFDMSKVIGRIYRKMEEIKGTQIKIFKEEKEETIDVISEIIKVFEESEIIEKSYEIKELYKVNLYLPEYRIIIDCTENGLSELENEKRILFINKSLKIDDTYWIKYDNEINDISKIIGEVLLLMKNKKKTIKRVCATCKKSKDLEDFHRSNYQNLGRDYSCKNCRNMKSKIKNEKRRETLTEITEKICKTCEETKDIEHFWKGVCYKDGYCSNCKICEVEYRKKIQDEKRKLPENFKECTKCNEIKAKQEFNKKNESYDGISTICKICMNSMTAEKKEKERGFVQDSNIVKVFHDENGKRYFVASEVAKMLGYDRSDILIRYIPKEEKILYKNVKNIVNGPYVKNNMVLITTNDIRNFMTNSKRTVEKLDEYSLGKLKRLTDEEDELINILIEE